MGKFAFLLAIVATVAALAVACGEDEETPTPAATATTPAATATTPAATATTPAATATTPAATATTPAATATTPAATATAPATGEPFTIGVIQSLTGAGETYGQVGSNAIQLAAEEINAAGGVNGRPIELVVEDGKCAARDAITAYTKLTQVDGVKIILGTSCSGAMLGIGPLAEKDKVVLFTGLASNALISDIKYHLRTIPNDASTSFDAANAMWNDGVRKLATINEATDYATGVQQGILPRWEELGGEILAQEKFESAETDFRTLLTRVIESKPDAIFIVPQAEAAGGTMVKQLRELGYTGPIYGESVLTGTTAQDIAGELMTGVKGVFAEIDPTLQRSLDFVARFQERFQYITLRFYAGATYDTMAITAKCLAETNDDQDVDGFLACAHALENYEGTIGTYQFDERGEAVGLANSLVEILPPAERTKENGGFKVLGPIQNPKP